MCTASPQHFFYFAAVLRSTVDLSGTVTAASYIWVYNYQHSQYSAQIVKMDFASADQRQVYICTTSFMPPRDEKHARKLLALHS